MHIDRFVIRQIAIPLTTPFRSRSGLETVRRVVIVEAHQDGIIGYGEASPLSSPYYSEETVDTVWHAVIDHLLPTVMNLRSAHPSTVAHALTAFQGHNMAKSGVEGALWDLSCKQDRIPLFERIGGTVDRVPSGVAVGLSDDPDETVRRVSRALDDKYHRIKIKIDRDNDLDLLDRLRTQLGDFPLMADANSGYTIHDARRLKQLDAFDLLMIEQPFHRADYVDHAHLQTMISTPICLDEGIETIVHLEQALRLRSCRVINIKPGRVGGLTESLRMHEMCQNEHIDVWCGGLLESDIGRAHNVALASLPGFTFPGDISPTNRYFKEQLVDPPFTLDDEGFIAIPNRPGIGVHVNTDLLNHITERTATIT